MTWRETIQAARERGGFTAQDRVAASDFTTCAVSEHRRAVPAHFFYTGGTPIDRCLHDSGMEFWDAVMDNDFDAADRLLDVIEDRALALKRKAT